MHSAITLKGDHVILEVKVVPASSKNAWIAGNEEVIRIKIAAAPTDGKANAALIKFVAQSLGCRKADVVILSGEHSRVKRLQIPALVLKNLERVI